MSSSYISGIAAAAAFNETWCSPSFINGIMKIAQYALLAVTLVGGVICFVDN